MCTETKVMSNKYTSSNEHFLSHAYVYFLYYRVVKKEDNSSFFSCKFEDKSCLKRNVGPMVETSCHKNKEVVIWVFHFLDTENLLISSSVLYIILVAIVFGRTRGQPFHVISLPKKFVPLAPLFFRHRTLLGLLTLPVATLVWSRF